MYAGCGFLCSRKSWYYIKKKTFTYSEKSAEEREDFTNRLKRIPHDKRIYIDESGINTYLQREYARAPRGEIIEDIKRGKKFERINIIGAQCETANIGIECYRQTTDGDFFESWFKDYIADVFPKGYTAIMDNARFHRKKNLQKIARGKVRLLFLPPYSPDYNPIEKSWANMKRYLRNNLMNYHSIESAIYDYYGVTGY